MTPKVSASRDSQQEIAKLENPSRSSQRSQTIDEFIMWIAFMLHSEVELAPPFGTQIQAQAQAQFNHPVFNFGLKGQALPAIRDQAQVS